MKRCPRCGLTKPLEEFGKDRTKPGGRMSHCKECANAARKARYNAKLPHERERSRRYYADNRETARGVRTERRKAAYAADPEGMRRYWREQSRKQQKAPHRRENQRTRYMKRHGGVEEWARMYAEQDGLCYLCQEPLPEDGKDVHVDHDHTCCEVGPRDSQSCRYCRRGLTHQACNQIWGLARENPAMLRLLADNGERVWGETRQRIAAKPAIQSALWDEWAS